MEIEIPLGNWHMALADAIKDAQNGDVIIVKTEAQVELGGRAKERMCPDKEIMFEIKQSV